MRGRQLDHWPFNHRSYLSTAAATERSRRSRQGGGSAERKILLTDCQRRSLLFSIISQHWNQNPEKALLIFAELRELRDTELEYITSSFILQKLLSKWIMHHPPALCQDFYQSLNISGASGWLERLCFIVRQWCHRYEQRPKLIFHRAPSFISGGLLRLS